MKHKHIKPILFNTQMVRAIIDGKKTETRRIIKPQPCMKLAYSYSGFNEGYWFYPSKNAWRYWGERFKRPDDFPEEDENKSWRPPYHTDDILYVRETFAPMYKSKDSDEIVGYMYKEQTLEEYDKMYPDGKDYYWEGKWKPSIHMPKEAARIWLTVKNVYTERLQDITVRSAIREGITFPHCVCGNKGDGKCPIDSVLLKDCPMENMDQSFEKLWDETVPYPYKKIYGWSANPFVWVIEFEKLI